jgi:hypothetical protein
VDAKTWDVKTENIPLFLDRAALELLRWDPVPGCPGVFDKELWCDGDFVHALIRYEFGAASPGRPHLAAHHHLWILSGTATIAGRRVAAGTYVHIPPDVVHPVSEVGPDGCVLLQLHRPYGPR